MKSFERKYMQEGKKIIIYGAGRYGELAYRGLQYWNIQPLYFADRKLAGTEYMGIKVIHPSELIKFREDIILIATYNYFYDMLKELQSMHLQNYYDISKLLELDYDEHILSEYALDEKRNCKKYFTAVENANAQGLVVVHCEIVLTECCSLRCKDCANLMQYYSKPENIDANDIITDFQKFLDCVDVVLELRLLGGEPFLHKEIDQVIYAFHDNDKIKRISVYTNSTIIPTDKVLESLKNSKVSVHMSDYGVKNSKVDQLKTIFEEQNIHYYVHQYEKWYEAGTTDKKEYSQEMRDQIYKDCMQANCHTFYRGKFYVCPRAAHGERLNFFANKEDEVVDFTNSLIDVEQKRKQLITLLDRETSITACDYCNGMSTDSKEVAAALQMI